MKKVFALIVSILMFVSFSSITVIFALQQNEERYTVTLYEDSTKSKVLYKKINQKAGNIFLITFDVCKDGYSFVSWIDAETGEEISFYNNIVTVPEKNAEYYVHWQINSYNLVYSNCGKKYADYEVTYSTPAYEMPMPEDTPVRDGYEFEGWSALPATMPASDMVVTAIWKDVCTQANFYINPEDSQPYESVPLNKGETVNPPSERPTKTGYTFKGWSLDGKNVTSNLGVMGEKDISVYALWTPQKYYASFNAVFGVFSDGSTSKWIPFDYGEKIVIKDIPKCKGLIFNGWTPETGVMDNVNGKNFRATWIREDERHYTVRTYVMGTDGRYTYTEKMYSGNTGDIVSADYTIEEGFELNRARSYLTGVVNDESTLVLKVYLDRKLCDYYVNVDGLITRETYLYGEKTTIPDIPEKDGYVFVGWEPAHPATMPATDYTVTAIWKEAEEVHVHTEKTVVIEPTCEDEGKKYVICEVCGESIAESTVIPATGHSEGDWIVTLEPTYESEGVKAKNCLICGKKLKEELIEKLDEPESPTVKPCNAVLSINNNPGTVALKYGERISVSAETENMPEESYIKWSISGEGIIISGTDADGCVVESISTGTAKLTATLVDSEGNPVRNADGEKISDSVFINSQAGLLQRIVAFYKKIFILNF